MSSDISFSDRLAKAVTRCKSPAMVGLDPRKNSLPAALLDPSEDDPNKIAAAYKTFCCEIVDVVKDLVPIVKPQAAFFEQFGPAGTKALYEVTQYASNSGLLVCMDAKRNDIGSTAEAYADGYLGAHGKSVWGADSLTVSPYLGDDSLQPFIEVAKDRDAGLFVLVKTSNPGGGMFQDLEADQKSIYQHVADYVEQQAVDTKGECNLGSIGAVIGATYPEQLVQLRERMPHTWFLVPGFGSQGGTAEDVAGAFRPDGFGAVINSSRGIIFAYQKEPYASRFGEANWQSAVAAATKDMIAQLQSDTPAGVL